TRITRPAIWVAPVRRGSGGLGRANAAAPSSHSTPPRTFRHARVSERAPPSARKNQRRRHNWQTRLRAPRGKLRAASNPKSESRNPKQIRISKSETVHLGHSNFGF